MSLLGICALKSTYSCFMHTYVYVVQAGEDLHFKHRTGKTGLKLQEN